MFDWDEVPEHLGGPNKAALDIEAEAKDWFMMIHGSILSQIEPETNPVENDGKKLERNGWPWQVDAAKPKEETPAERAARRRSERQQGGKENLKNND